MSLLIYVQFCVLTIVSCTPSPLLSGDEPYFEPGDIHRGNYAENYLLTDAELLHYASPQMILYRKRGSGMDAERDFHWLNEMKIPKYAQATDRWTVSGQVGNRELTLYEGIGVYPQISITKFELGTGSLHRYTKVFWYYGKPRSDNN